MIIRRISTFLCTGAVVLAFGSCASTDSDSDGASEPVTGDDDVVETPGADDTPAPSSEPTQTPTDPVDDDDAAMDDDSADDDSADDDSADDDDAAMDDDSADDDDAAMDDDSADDDDGVSVTDDDASVDGGVVFESVDGVCGQRGEGTVTVDDFDGTEEFYIIGDEGFGVDVCVVSVDVVRIGAAPEGCVDLEGAECVWTHKVEYRNPALVLDDNGACASSLLALDMAAIEAIEGTQASYGFVSEYVGHNSVILKYDEASGDWVPNGNATWEEESGSFRFNRRDGLCSYDTPVE